MLPRQAREPKTCCGVCYGATFNEQWLEHDRVGDVTLSSVKGVTALADFDSPSNGDKSSSAHLSKQKQILLGEDLGMIIERYLFDSER